MNNAKPAHKAVGPLPELDQLLRDDARKFSAEASAHHFNANVTFTFKPSDQINYDIDPNNGHLSITCRMAPIHELPDIFSHALMDWIGQHLSATSGGSALTKASHCLLEAIKHDALTTLLAQHSTTPTP